MRKSQNWPVVPVVYTYYVRVRRLPPAPLRYVRRLTPGSPPYWKPPVYRSLTTHTENRARILPGTPGILSSAVAMHRVETEQASEATNGRWSRLVFSNRDFTSTLYSGMRASCATPADLSRPLPHYLVHAPRPAEMPRWRNSFVEHPGLPPAKSLASAAAKLTLARVCFASILRVDSSRRNSRLRVQRTDLLADCR